jgi:hypothetical protein
LVGGVSGGDRDGQQRAAGPAELASGRGATPVTRAAGVAVICSAGCAAIIRDISDSSSASEKAARWTTTETPVSLVSSVRTDAGNEPFQYSFSWRAWGSETIEPKPVPSGASAA